MFTKEFVPCIYLYHKNCVMSLQDLTVISEDPVKLAQSYCDAGADALIVFDMSETDAEHDAALDIMKPFPKALPSSMSTLSRAARS